ncbi:hypothetical protein [Dermatophilus congolensis]|uniref:hypothetical protein n=1 Tax=Dermatophilus congolensis TaxID=1863 RepID=UPI001AAE9715|nr:hypothetical protein [Dermatophilus congolensis]MBO3141923.1 hypothetical protein [Dermatophilus congolensis]MBO3150917.1 hypothetical protein [Dermatophilus congolensis]MBO3162078.1 hypothetical protein [Dermatophilus congolensis]MBO3162197.1 hypothetical protein [Dermatophilus congolensis]MBO3175753.1 hypothetical protein [Dermatophilus congolensis]
MSFCTRSHVWFFPSLPARSAVLPEPHLWGGVRAMERFAVVWSLPAAACEVRGSVAAVNSMDWVLRAGPGGAVFCRLDPYLSRSHLETPGFQER